MPTIDSLGPVFYILFGALMVLVGLGLWRSLQARFSSPERSRDQVFNVHIVEGHAPRSPKRRWQWDTLTPREVEVAQLVAQGRRNAEIARELHISILTVETHLKHIYSKLNIRSRTELARVLRDLVDE